MSQRFLAAMREGQEQLEHEIVMEVHGMAHDSRLISCGCGVPATALVRMTCLPMPECPKGVYFCMCNKQCAHMRRTGHQTCCRDQSFAGLQNKIRSERCSITPQNSDSSIAFGILNSPQHRSTNALLQYLEHPINQSTACARLITT